MPKVNREHINADGEFQSDKYPWCKPGFVPLKLSDPDARIVLAQYCVMRRLKDPSFSQDLQWAIYQEKAKSNDNKTGE